MQFNYCTNFALLQNVENEPAFRLWKKFQLLEEMLRKAVKWPLKKWGWDPPTTDFGFMRRRSSSACSQKHDLGVGQLGCLSAPGCWSWFHPSSWYPSFQLLSFHTSYWKSCNLLQTSIFFYTLCSQISMCTVMKGPVETANQTFSLVLGSQAQWTLAGCFVLPGFHQERRAIAFDGSQPVPCTDPSSLWGTWTGRKMYEGFHK